VAVASEHNENEPVDLLVVGGGINGAGIARDAAGRGLSVALVEERDLAGATSSASTKLIHGGLRYLEYYEFRLVREALAEREVLLANAPHIIRPLTFILPHEAHLRPAWMIRIGLFLYDHLGGRKRLPGSRAVDLRADAAGQPLKQSFAKGFAYADCWVDDARLVVLNALGAAERGAAIATRTRCLEARRDGAQWLATLEDTGTRARREIRARALVNATGPWVAAFMERSLARPPRHRLRLVKGSHIVVPRLFAGPQCYILQLPDRRVVFAIPYEGEFTLIGTTDIVYQGDPGRAAISPEETRYLCEAVNAYFERQIAPGDVVWSYAGVRPLRDDESANASAVTRDYVLEVDDAKGQAPLLSVFGGKITTYRRLAEQALEKLRPYFPKAGPSWTARAPLPGGDMPDADFEGFLARLIVEAPWLPPALARRYARAYGTRVSRLIAGARGLADLGASFGGGLYLREVEYLVAEEWARSADDVLWRRSKLGLHVDRGAVAALESWFRNADAARLASRA
jgi:glycerol-3-phosphate dehydrogenase